MLWAAAQELVTEMETCKHTGTGSVGQREPQGGGYDIGGVPKPWEQKGELLEEGPPELDFGVC